jgi:hypothetical protein
MKFLVGLCCVSVSFMLVAGLIGLKEIGAIVGTVLIVSAFFDK